MRLPHPWGGLADGQELMGRATPRCRRSQRAGERLQLSSPAGHRLGTVPSSVRLPGGWAHRAVQPRAGCGRRLPCASGSTRAPFAHPMNANGPVGSVPWSHIPEAVMWGIMVLAWVAGLVPSEIKGQWCDLGRPYILLGSSDWPGGAWVQAGIWAV